MNDDVVGALCPAIKGELLQLSGPQYVGCGVDNSPGRGAVAGDRGRNAAARRPAVGER